MEPISRPLREGEITALHERYLFPCVQTYYDEPLPLARGKGMYVYDAAGREYLDFFGGILTVSVGHCNDEVNAAIARQNETLQHVSTLYPTEPMGRLAAKLAEITPGRLTRSFFTNSGTEADEAAVLLARIATGRTEVITLRHAYSGRTELGMNLTAQAGWRQAGSTVSYVKHAHNAYCYRCSFGQTYPSCELRCATDLEELIQTTTSGEPAAFMAEPIQGIGGFVTPPPEYFEVAVGIARKYGALFICDEVQTGFGRTGGRWFGIEHWGVEPDIMTFAKGIANGIPLGATIATDEVSQEFCGLSISTFGGNPVSSAAGLATIEFIERNGLVQNAAAQGERLRQGLLGLQEKYPAIGDVRGMGLMQALELVDPAAPGGKEPAPEVMARVFERCRELGLLVGKSGIQGNIMRISPPLIVSGAEIDQALELLDQAFAEGTEAPPA